MKFRRLLRLHSISGSGKEPCVNKDNPIKKQMEVTSHEKVCLQRLRLCL